MCATPSALARRLSMPRRTVGTVADVDTDLARTVTQNTPGPISATADDRRQTCNKGGQRRRHDRGSRPIPSRVRRTPRWRLALRRVDQHGDCRSLPLACLTSWRRHHTNGGRSRSYLRSQSGDDFEIEHVEKLTSEYVLGRQYDVWDAHTSDGRWWVITNPVNLYSQDQIKSMDIALSFHIGLMSRMMASKPPPAARRTPGCRRSPAGWTWQREPGPGQGSRGLPGCRHAAAGDAAHPGGQARRPGVPDGRGRR